MPSRELRDDSADGPVPLDSIGLHRVSYFVGRLRPPGLPGGPTSGDRQHGAGR